MHFTTLIAAHKDENILTLVSTICRFCIDSQHTEIHISGTTKERSGSHLHNSKTENYLIVHNYKFLSIFLQR